MAITLDFPGGSGGGSWGAITGTLSAQTDLQAALDAKLNLAGGTLTGALTINAASGPFLDIKQSSVDVFKVSSTASGTCLDSLSGAGCQALMGPGGIYLGRRDDSTPATASGYEAWIGNYNGSGINIRGSGFYGFGDSSGNNLHSIRHAAFYYGGAAATIQMGANHATTATHQTFKAHDVTTGAGADLILQGGAGSANDGYVKIGTATGGLAFFGAAGSPLISGNTNTNISSAGVGSALLDDTQSDGGLAGGAYTFGGLVAALKSYGIIG